jgi:Big-like domain-containing protein/alpha-galactosidase-like protein/gametolysin peptidase M11
MNLTPPAQALRRHATGAARVACASLLSLAFLTMPMSGQAASAEAPSNAGTSTAQAAQAAQVTRAEKLSLDLPGLNARHRAAAAGEKAARLREVIAAAAERRTLLARIIESNPGAVLRMALPPRVRAGFPSEVQTYLEQRQQLQGELEVRYEDHPGGKTRLRHFLTAGSQKIALHFATKSPTLPTGAAVQASGVRVGNDLALESGETSLALLTSDGTTSAAATASSAPLTDTLGEQRTLVVMVNFQNDASNQPWSSSDVRSMVFTTVSNFMRENSYGQTWLAGDVSGWHTIAQDNTVCDSDKLATLANQAAAAAGYDVASYRRFVYIYPMVASCGWSGMSTVGGNPSRSWINGKFNLMTIAHELGHAFGLSHSHALECGATTLGSSCQIYEYGDHFDIMGNYTTGHFSAFQKAQLGWLGFGASPGLTTVQSAGTYPLEPYESLSFGAKALRIPKGIDPATGAQAWYYLEFRQALGADNFLAGNTKILSGVVTHSGVDNNLNSHYQLDVTPASQSYGWDDWEDAAIAVGASYIDSSAGVTLRTVSASGNGASVAVDFGTQSCVRGNPVLALTPAQGPWVAPGTAVNYVVSVTNKDNSACGTSSFSVQPTAPTGWTASVASAPLSLSPGQTATATLTVSSPTAAGDGFYTITVLAANATAPGTSASGSVSYAVSAAAGNHAPLAVNDSATMAVNTAANIAVLGNDSDPDGDPLTVATVTQGAHGKTSINADGTVLYTPNRRYTGSDSFSYQVTDGFNTVSATVTVAVASSGSGGNGGGKGH